MGVESGFPLQPTTRPSKRRISDLAATYPRKSALRTCCSVSSEGLVPSAGPLGCNGGRTRRCRGWARWTARGQDAGEHHRSDTLHGREFTLTAPCQTLSGRRAMQRGCRLQGPPVGTHAHRARGSGDEALDPHVPLHMPRELAACVERANLDPTIHVIAASGNGKGFCGGYSMTTRQRRSTGGLYYNRQTTRSWYPRA